MSQATFIGLINNAALLLALCLVYDMLGFRRPRRQRLSIQLLAGVILGGIGLTIMLTPWTFGSGVVFDTRSVLLATSGLFLGTIPTLIAMVMTGIFRFLGGGAGVWMGVTVIALSGLTGLAWRHLRRRDTLPTPGELYAMGMVAHLLMLAATVLLPGHLRGEVLSEIGLPVLTIYPLTTAILGNLMVRSERRRRAEEELRQSEERYRQLVESANSIILRLDAEGRIVFANAFAIGFFGYAPEELLHRPVIGTIVPATASDGTDLQAMVADLYHQPHNYLLQENENIRKDGSTAWVTWTNKAFFDEQGQLREILCIGNDNSERKQAEKALQATTTLLDSIRVAQSLYIRQGETGPVCQALLATLVEMTDSEFGFLDEVRRDPDGSPYKVSLALSDIAWNEESAALYQQLLAKNLEFRNLHNLAGFSVLAGEAVIANDAPHDPRSGGLPSGHPPIRALMTLPIRSGGEIIGVLGVANRPGGYDQELARFLEPYCSACAGIIEGIRSRERESRAVLALQESERNFRAFFASIPDMLFIADGGGGLLLTNHILQEISGHDPHELSKMSISRLFPDEVLALFPPLLSGDSPGMAKNDSTQLLTKDGKTIPVTITLWPGVWDGEACIYGACRDRRREVEAEKRFEQMFRHNPALMALTREDDRTFVDINDTWVAAVGYGRAEVLGKTAQELGLFADPAQLRAIADQLRLQGRINDVELAVRCKDGRMLHGLFFGERIGSGGDSHFLTVMLDISERKRMESERRQLESRLQLAHKMEALGTLAGGIAHDFNNILGAVIGYSEMAKEDCPEDTELAHSIDQVLKAGMRAKELVKQILAFSRQSDQELQPLQPAPIVGEAIKLLRASIPSTIEISCEIAKDTDPLLATPTQLHQILMNLCSNAAHAMEDRGGTLSVRLRQVAIDEEEAARRNLGGSGSYLRLTVEDSGCGMDETIRSRIFDPYFTTKEPGKGTGMGLAIVHGIVHNLGGAVDCQSRPGEGSLFEVLLPTVREAAATEASQEEWVPGGNERILFVDDEEPLVRTNSTILQRLGYRVTAMTDSMEALATFLAAPDDFDLLITDQTMPRLTGGELAERVLALRPEFPILLCTGYSSQISPNQARDLGIKGYLNKPMTKRDLALAIRALFAPQGY